MKQLVAGIVALAVAGVTLYVALQTAQPSSAGLAPPGGKDHFTLGPASSISIELDGVEGIIVVPLHGTLYWERSDPHEPEPGTPIEVEQVIDITGGAISASGPASMAGHGVAAGPELTPEDFLLEDQGGLTGQIWVQPAFGSVAYGLGLNGFPLIQFTLPGEEPQIAVTNEPIHFETFINLPAEDTQQLNSGNVNLPFGDPINPGPKFGAVRSIKLALEPTEAGPTITVGPTTTLPPTATSTPLPTATATEEPLPGVDDTPEPTETGLPPGPTATNTPTATPESVYFYGRVSPRGSGSKTWEFNLFEGADCVGSSIAQGQTDDPDVDAAIGGAFPVGLYSISLKPQRDWALGGFTLPFPCQTVNALAPGGVYSKFFAYRLDGDVNDDDRTNAVDASLLLQLTSGLISEDDLSNFGDAIRGDVNRDDVVDSRDAALVLQYTAGLIDHLPVGGN